MTVRKHNFNPGPSVLPLEVLEKAKEDLFDYKSSGVGVLEMSHRTPLFEGVVEEINKDLKELLNIPDNYSIVLTTGGATQQFSMVPMNLAGESVANYLITGFWADKASVEGHKLGKAHNVASSKEQNYSFIPKELNLSENAAYLHFTSNNTIVGTQFHTEPKNIDKNGKVVPLICDASSDILSKKIDVTKYGLIYAGAQKNIGTAGVTLVIIRNDLLERSPKTLPALMNYNIYVNNSSLQNTPPMFPYYIMNEMLKWMKNKGGVDFFSAKSIENAEKIYKILDAKEIYKPCSAKEDRSKVNIVFKFDNEEIENKFLKEADKMDIYGIKGHKLFGGMRISLYNAIPQKSVDTVSELLEKFSV